MALSFVVNKEEFAANATDLGGTFELLPKGNYEVALLDAKIKPFGGNGANKDMTAYHITWKLTENNETGANRRLWTTTVLGTKWAQGSRNFSFDQLVNALGIVPDDDGAFDFPDEDEILDMDVVIGVEVGINEYNGKESNRVERFLTQEQLEKRNATATPKASTAEKAKGSDKPNGMFV